MKIFKFLFLTTLTLFPALSFAQDGSYKPAILKPEVVFAPQGFDTNDNAQIILYGRFGDVCRKVAPPKYSVDLAKHEIYVQNRILSKGICPMIWVNSPYTVVINLDTLPKGTYTVLTSDDKGVYTPTNTLPIAEAKKPNDVDNYLYAQIDNAQVSTHQDGITRLDLTGTIRNTCLELKEVKVIRSKGNIYDILPIMEMTSQSNCQLSDTPFERTVELPNIPEGPALANIRTFGGQSIEKVIDLRLF